LDLSKQVFIASFASKETLAQAQLLFLFWANFPRHVYIFGIHAISPSLEEDDTITTITILDDVMTTKYQIFTHLTTLLMRNVHTWKPILIS
jgi:hypothetical protein